MSNGWIFCVRPVEGYLGYFVDRTGSAWSQKKRGPSGGLAGGLTRMAVKDCFPPNRQVSVTLPGPNRRRVSKLLGRAILSAFRGPCPEGMQCRHLNGDYKDCRIENLAWGTVKENHGDKSLHGTNPEGERNPKAKLTEDDVRRIRSMSGTHKSVAEEFNVTPELISQIRRRLVWKHC